MTSRAHLEQRRVERTLSSLRVLVAAGVAVYLLLHLGDLRDADVLGIGVGDAIGLLLAAAALLAAWRVARAPRALLAVGIIGFVLDAVLLATAVGVALVAHPGVDLVWAFLLWLPFSAGVRWRGSLALAASAASMLVVPLVLALARRHMGAEFAWADTVLPMLVLAAAGVSSQLNTTCQRLAVNGVRSDLARAQNRSSQLQEADELKNTFLAAVSHELRTPLTSIMGFSMTLLDRQDELTREQRDRMLTTLVVEAEHLEDILANLLDLDRLTRGKATIVPSDVDAAELVAAAVSHVRRRSEREITLDLEAGVHVVLDASKVERIVENLVGNAVKYTPGDSEIIVTLARESRGITICVDDSGPGIAPELRDTIFEPFRRGTDIGVPGTGIGLSLVDRFSRLHGGRAWVEARPGGGSRFQVHLPSIERPGGGGSPPSGGLSPSGGCAGVADFRIAQP